MKFNFETAKVPKSFTDEFGQKSFEYLNELAKHQECLDSSHFEDFLHLKSSDIDLQKANEIKEKFGNGLKCVYVIGIGGANLGAQAVTLALRYSVVQASAKILFFDTIDPYFFDHIKVGSQSLQKKEDFAVVIISKSGETIETIANANMILSVLESKFGDISDRIAVISAESSPLYSGVPKEISKISVHENLVDRYSVFSIIGLLPIVLGGMDADSFLAGAKKCNELCFGTDFESNPVIGSSLATFYSYQNDIKIRDFFFFIPELEYLGKWSRQLVAESLGKGGKGIAPTVSIGTTDLHSVAQLYLDGPNERFTTLISLENFMKVEVGLSSFSNVMPEIVGKTTDKIISSILDGYKKSLEKKEFAFVEMILDELSEYEIGFYMQFMMIETYLLSKLLGVNAFDQKAVEAYKKEARNWLGIK